MQRGDIPALGAQQTAADRCNCSDRARERARLRAWARGAPAAEVAVGVECAEGLQPFESPEDTRHAACEKQGRVGIARCDCRCRVRGGGDRRKGSAQQALWDTRWKQGRGDG